MGSGLEDAEIHEVAAPEDGGADGADLLASSLERASSEVLGSGLNLVVDGYAVEEHVLRRVDDEPLGVAEGVAHFLKLGDIIVADFIAVLHGGGDLGDERAELIDASGNLVEGAILEVLESGFQVGNKGADILDASFNVGDAFGFECAKEDTFDHLEHILSSAFFNTDIHIKDAWAATPVSTAVAIVFVSIAPIASRPERAFFATFVGWVNCYAAS